MKLIQEEELVANGLKILRYCIKDENNHQRTIIEYPDMINDIIQNVMPLYD